MIKVRSNGWKLDTVAGLINYLLFWVHYLIFQQFNFELTNCSFTSKFKIITYKFIPVKITPNILIKSIKVKFKVKVLFTDSNLKKFEMLGIPINIVQGSDIFCAFLPKKNCLDFIFGNCDAIQFKI